MGQRQRVAIARAIVNDPDIILADEPTGSLDSETGSEVMDILKKLNSDGKTILIVTHDKNVASYCHRIVKIKDGKVSDCLLYTSPSPRDLSTSRMPSSA